MRENEVQNAENSSERVKSSRCERDGLKIKHPEQDATRAREVFQQPVMPVRF